MPVSGRVTFGGGDWPKNGVIYFRPDDKKKVPGFDARPSHAEFGPDGKFVAKIFEDQAGLWPGTYEIGVECWEEMPNMEKGTQGKSYVPPGFKAAPLEIKADDGAKTLNFDVPKK